MKPRFDALAWTRGRTTVLVWLWLTCCVVGKVAFGDRTIPSITHPRDGRTRAPPGTPGEAGTRDRRPGPRGARAAADATQAAPACARASPWRRGGAYSCLYTATEAGRETIKSVYSLQFVDTNKNPFVFRTHTSSPAFPTGAGREKGWVGRFCFLLWRYWTNVGRVTCIVPKVNPKVGVL
jgi:hypothetical protein